MAIGWDSWTVQDLLDALRDRPFDPLAVEVVADIPNNEAARAEIGGGEFFPEAELSGIPPVGSPGLILFQERENVSLDESMGVSDALTRREWARALELAIGEGMRDENDLANLLFFARHGELGGRKLDPTKNQGDKNLAQEWARILTSEVRPAIRRASVDASLKVSGDYVAERDPQFSGEGGRRFKELVKWAASEVDINPGLLAATLLAEWDQSSLYLGSKEIRSFKTGTDDFFIQRKQLRANVPAFSKVRFDPKDVSTDFNEHGREVTTIRFKSGRDAALATAVYLKYGEIKLRRGAQRNGGDFDALPVDTRLALTRIAMTAGHGGIDKNGELLRFKRKGGKWVVVKKGEKGGILRGVAQRLRRTLNGDDILVRRNEQRGNPTSDPHITDRNATILVAQAMHVSDWFFGIPLTLPVQREPEEYESIEEEEFEDEEFEDEEFEEEESPGSEEAATLVGLTLNDGIAVGTWGRRRRVAQLQERLNAHGASLKSDGMFGPSTARFLRQFQSRLGMPEQDTVDSAAADALVAQPAPGPLTISRLEGLTLNDGIAFGTFEKRRAVSELQLRLTSAGFPCKEDGLFGQETAKALHEFQGANGLPQADRVDRPTADRLEGRTGPVPEVPLLIPKPGAEPSAIELPGGLQVLVRGIGEGPVPGLPPNAGELPTSSQIPGPAGIPPVLGSPGVLVSERLDLNATCTYLPGEKQRTADDPGGGFVLVTRGQDPVLGIPIDIPGGSFGIVGFTQGSEQLKDEHKQHLKRMVDFFELGGDSPRRRIRLIEGFTDCVDRFDRNLTIRRQRAILTQLELMNLGVRSTTFVNLSPVASQQVLDATQFARDPRIAEEGRRQNRAVVCHVDVIPQPPTDKFPFPPIDLGCDAISSTWAFRTKSPVGAAGTTRFLGGSVVAFDVINKTSNCVHSAEFVAFGFVTPGATVPSPGTALSILSPKVTDPVITSSDVHADELDGFGAMRFLTVGFGGVLKATIVDATIAMSSGPILGPEIAIGPVSITGILPIKAGLLAGRLFVHRVGRPL